MGLTVSYVKIPCEETRIKTRRFDIAKLYKSLQTFLLSKYLHSWGDKKATHACGEDVSIVAMKKLIKIAQRETCKAKSQ